MYDYKNGKRNILDILNSKTKIEKKDTIPSNEADFTYENGIKSWTGALFVDIKNSTEMFKDDDQEKLARVMRAFCSEIISILKQNSNYRQIGIRGDCVYAIYTASYKKDLETILDDAIMINTFQEMFQEILRENSFKPFLIGIGLGASESLIIKAGMKGTGISDNIWIGDSVVDASKLSGQGNRDSFSTIVMDSCFYKNIKDFDANETQKYAYCFQQQFSNKLLATVYHGNMVHTDFDKWVSEGMK